MMWQDGQIAEIISRSSISSWPQPTLPRTFVIGPPVWLTWVRVPEPTILKWVR